MPVLQEIREGRVPVKVYTSDIEPQARQQLVNISTLPIVHHHVAAMPDVHLGIGATVGSVIPTRSAIIPAAVGVDIGCGMIATRLSLGANDLDEKRLKRVFDQISRDVPVGFNQHNERDARSHAAKPFARGLRRILDRHSGIEKRVGKRSSWVRQLGVTSLLVYWVHIELVYGRWFGFWKESLSLTQCALAAFALILLMIGLSYIRTHWNWRLPQRFGFQTLVPRRASGD